MEEIKAPISNHIDTKGQDVASGVAAMSFPDTKSGLEPTTHQKMLAAPSEVYLEIFGHLNTWDLKNANLVSQRWTHIITKHPSLWLRHVKIGGTFKETVAQWKKILAYAKGKPRVITLCVGHQDRRPAGGQEEYFLHEEKMIFGFDSFKREFLATFPFDTVEYIFYLGTCGDADVAFWDALKDCSKLQDLEFTSWSDKSESYIASRNFASQWFRLDKFPVNSPITKCPIKKLFIDTRIAVDLSGFCLNALKDLTILSNLRPDDVRATLTRAAATVEMVKITRITTNRFIECNKKSCRHDTIDCIYYYSYKDVLHMPALKSFWATSAGTQKQITEETDSFPCPSRVSYNIEAPSLSILRYEHYLGWDTKLFESCSDKLESVYFELNNGNIKHIYKDAIGKLSACTMLILWSNSELYHQSAKKDDPPHPFLGKYHKTKEQPPAKVLTKLEGLCIVHDKEITLEALMQFVKYKKSIDSPLRELTLIGCPKIQKSAKDQLKSYVEKCKIDCNLPRAPVKEESDQMMTVFALDPVTGALRPVLD